MSEYVTYTVEDGIARVILDAPGEKVNLLGMEFLKALERTADKLARQAGIRGAVVISGKEGGFIAGADIRMIEGVTEAEQGTEFALRGQRVLDRWAALPFPVVAAVHGHCMGGGTEFILACRYRIVAEDAAIAFPEVNLGIFPGLGGTQRLPRLISLEKAIGMILTGRTVRAPEALAIGLADRMTARESLLTEAISLARQAIADPHSLHRHRQSGWRSFLLEKNPVGRALLFRQARRSALKKTGGHYPAPLAALKVIRRGRKLPLPQALALEAREFGPLAASPISKNLIHVFFLSQRPKRRLGSMVAPSLDKAAVIGAGVMGGGIAQLLAAHHVPVLLKDIRPEAVEAGLAQARTTFRRQAEKRGEDEGKVAARMALITGATEYRGVAEVDLVIEAVVEKMPVKQAVLREVEPLLPIRTLFATNTSALSVTELQKTASHPERIGGMHFFNPVDRMPLVEIVRGDQTSDETVNALYAAALRLGKIPVVTADRPGFLVNRLLGIYLDEAAQLAAAGVDWVSLDRAATAFGLPMGPFRLLDEVGIDIAAEVAGTLARAFPYMQGNSLLEKALAAGFLGKKGGGGFYLYQGGKETRPNPEIDAVIGGRRGRPATEADLRRMLYLMVNEAGRCLEERMVGEAADVDTGTVFGTGFPPFRGGLCRWADREGRATITDRLRELAILYGDRFAPCRYLLEKPAFYEAEETG